MNERTIELIGENNFNKIKNSHILVVGVGGVGSLAIEALVRSGIGHLTIIDYDTYEASNLNRQLYCTSKNIGSLKTEECLKRIKEINPNIEVNCLNIFLNDETINQLNTYDYIIDACDNVNAKTLLIKYAQGKNIPIICSMGTGKRLKPELLKIANLDKTYNDSLAKIMRHRLKEEGLSLKIPVVFSTELPLNNNRNISSMIFVPASAGLLLASYCIEQIIKE